MTIKRHLVWFKQNWVPWHWGATPSVWFSYSRKILPSLFFADESLNYFRTNVNGIAEPAFFLVVLRCSYAMMDFLFLCFVWTVSLQTMPKVMISTVFWKIVCITAGSQKESRKGDEAGDCRTCYYAPVPIIDSYQNRSKKIVKKIFL